jgi:hypothetical protein
MTVLTWTDATSSRSRKEPSKMTELNKEQIENARELCAKATPGPWWGTYVGTDSSYRESAVSAPDSTPSLVASEMTVDDAKFIAYARDILPAALDTIDKLEAQNAAMREALQPMGETLSENAMARINTLWSSPDKDNVMIAPFPWTAGDARRVYAALASDAGKDLLAELRLKRKMVDVLAEKVSEGSRGARWFRPEYWIEQAESQAQAELAKEGGE